MNDSMTYFNVFERVSLGSDSSWMFNAERFDWNPGVFLAGAAEAYNKFKNKKILEYLKGWCDRHLDEAGKERTVNSSAPLIMVSELYILTGEERYRTACEAAAKWLTEEAVLTPDGGLEHTVTENAQFSGQMWADTLFMAVLFLAKWGNITHHKAYTDFAAKQLAVHHRILRDGQSGLFYHGWDGMARNHMSAAKWARANAWIILSTVLIINELPEDFEDRDFVSGSLLSLAAFLKECQHKDGGFSTVLDRPGSYCETSATAGIAAGIFYGIKHGLLPLSLLPAAKKAAEYVKKHILPEGSVTGVSTGTPVMPSIEAYFTIETGSTLYGQGLALFMLAYEAEGKENGHEL